MTRPAYDQTDPKLDLVLERVIDVPRDLVWQAWTCLDQLVGLVRELQQQ